MQMFGMRMRQLGVAGHNRRPGAAARCSVHTSRIQKIDLHPLRMSQYRQPRKPALRGASLECTASAAAAAAPLPQDGSSAGFKSENSRQGFPEWLAKIRALGFYLTTFTFALPLFCVMLAVYPFVMLFDKYRRRGEHFVNNIWAKLSTLFFYPIKFEGLENLPGPNQPAVYVANHLSFLDIYTLFHLNRDFKFISKTSNFLIPIIGWSMFLTGHVMINRVDRRSQLECLKQCGELLRKGASVLFFPEGTRSKDGKMYGFKKGAFSVAAKAKVPVVPITLVGTGDLMPNAREYLLFPGKVRVVVHPLIPAQDADSMMQQAQQQIAEGLPQGLLSEEVRGELAKAAAAAAAADEQAAEAAAAIVPPVDE